MTDCVVKNGLSIIRPEVVCTMVSIVFFCFALNGLLLSDNCVASFNYVSSWATLGGSFVYVSARASDWEDEERFFEGGREKQKKKKSKNFF